MADDKSNDKSHYESNNKAVINLNVTNLKTMPKKARGMYNTEVTKGYR